MSDMRRMIKFWTNENPGKPGSKQYEAAVQRTMTKFINGNKGKELLKKALRGAKGKKTKNKKTKKKRKGGKRKSMKRNKRSRRKRKRSKKRL